MAKLVVPLELRFSLFIANGVAMNIYYKKIGLNISLFWKNIIKVLPALIPPCIVGVIINYKIDLLDLRMFLICGSFYVIIYCISIWLFGMNKSEKQLMSGLLRHLRGYFRRKHGITTYFERQ